MKIRDCMKQNVVSIPATATVGEAAALFVARHIGLLPVIDEQGRLAGILSLRDMIALALPAFASLIADVGFVHDFGAVELARPAPETLAQPVTAIVRAATTVPEDCGLLRAYVLMHQHHLHDVPVVATDGALMGVASRVDVATAFLAGWQTGKAANR